MTTLRCSSLDRLLLCPGSRTLEDRVEKRDSGEGDEGTYVHAEIQHALIRDFGATNSGPIFFYTGKKYPVSAWLVGFCVREVAEKLPDDWSLEVEAPLAYSFDKFTLSGHIDALALSPDCTEAIAWDWKTVYNAVDVAECNEQACGYIALLKRAYPSLRKVAFYIVQPRVDEEMGFQRVSSVTVETTEAFMNNFERRIERALAHSMALSTGPKQCRFCPAKLQCPALAADAEFMKMIMTEEQLTAIKATPDDKTLAGWVLTSKTLEAAMDEAKEIAKERIASKGFITAEDGTNISVKETAGAYEVVNPADFQRALLTMIPVEELANVTKPSMGKIKDKIAEVMDIPKTGKKAAITAEGLFDAKLRMHCQQGTRKVLQFS